MPGCIEDVQNKEDTGKPYNYCGRVCAQLNRALDDTPIARQGKQKCALNGCYRRRQSNFLCCGRRCGRIYDDNLYAMLDQTDAARRTAAAETQFAQNQTRMLNERTRPLLQHDNDEGILAFLGIKTVNKIMDPTVRAERL